MVHDIIGSNDLLFRQKKVSSMILFLKSVWFRTRKSQTSFLSPLLLRTHPCVHPVFHSNFPLFIPLSIPVMILLFIHCSFRFHQLFHPLFIHCSLYCLSPMWTLLVCVCYCMWCYSTALFVVALQNVVQPINKCNQTKSVSHAEYWITKCMTGLYCSNSYTCLFCRSDSIWFRCVN